MQHNFYTFWKFFLRHFVASVMTIVLAIILVTVVYFFLLGYAILTNGDMGSPVAYPIWLFLIVLVSLFFTAFALFPSVALAEFASNAFGKLKYPLQMVLSTLVLAVIVFGLNYLWLHRTTMMGFEVEPWLVSLLQWTGILLIPLGIYWWTCKAVQGQFSVLEFVLRRVQRARA